MDPECKGCKFLGEENACKIKGLQVLLMGIEAITEANKLGDVVYSTTGDPRSDVVKLANYIEIDMKNKYKYHEEIYGPVPENQENGVCKLGDMKSCNRYEEPKVNWLHTFLRR